MIFKGKMKVIVGLGNPGDKYANTYHNMGFVVIDKLAKDLKVSFSIKSQLKSAIAKGNYFGEPFILVKPQTFMNLSGEAVESVINYFKADSQNCIVVYDDLDLDIGAIRYREKGSAGTHNGMRNIVLHIGENFQRLRIGTKKTFDEPTIDYVLSNVSKENFPHLNLATDNGVNLLLDFLKGNKPEMLMCAYNGKKA